MDVFGDFTLNSIAKTSEVSVVREPVGFFDGAAGIGCSLARGCAVTDELPIFLNRFYN